MSTEKPTCGRCGVYRHLHPTETCTKPRLSFWWDRHFLGRHLVGHVWLALSDKRRLTIASWWHGRHPRLCWCDLFNSAWLDFKKGDYRSPGCACDVPLPVDARAPRPGWCYCAPEENR